MNKVSKKIVGSLSFVGVLTLGYVVASHESTTDSRTTIEKIQLSDTAVAQSFDRGFADLVKHAIPGVVNISTYARPRYVPGMGGQDEMFRRFFEQFFGGRVPFPPNGQMRPGPNGDDENEGPQGGQPPGAPRARQGKAMPIALGTGFIIDSTEGLILTNNHVIQGAEEVKIQLKEDEPDLIPAQIIGRDPDLDVALLKIKTKTKLTAIPLGDSDAIDVGEYVLAMGNPLGYGHTVSHGILSAKGRRNPEFRMGLYLQTDASINPGNSGGPLINVKGEVIGINNAIDARAQGIGFAIPINLVKAVLTQLKTKGSVTRGYLGVNAADLTPELAEQLNIDPKLRGAIVSDVAIGQSADKAGVKPYDVITGVNGQKIFNSQDLTMKITSMAIGEKIKLDIVRAGKPKTLEGSVMARPSAETAQVMRGGRGRPSAGVNFADFGFKAENLNPQIAQMFRIPPNQHGVIISDVEEGKGAANSGLNPGDIILDVSIKGAPSVPVRNVTELDHALKTAESSAMIRVKRFDSAGNEFVSVIVLSK